jgi:hypothetical protein
MLADQKDCGNIMRSKCNHNPKRSAKMRYADGGEQAISRQPVVSVAQPRARNAKRN